MREGQEQTDSDHPAGQARPVEKDHKTVEELERQHVRDQTSIARLEHQGVVDRNRITELEAQSTVDVELIAVLTEQGLLDRSEIENLREALSTARRIGAAIGVLMATCKVDEAGAFDLLRKASQHTHRKLRDVADDLLYTGALAGE